MVEKKTETKKKKTKKQEEESSKKTTKKKTTTKTKPAVTEEPETKAEPEPETEPEPEPEMSVAELEEDIDAKIAKLNALKEEKHLAAEEEKFTSIRCECGTRLKVDPKDHVVFDTISKDYICPKCDKVTKVTSQYNQPPTLGEANIELINLGYVYEAYPTALLTDKQVEKKLLIVIEEVEKGESRLPEKDQLILRGIGLILKKR